MEKPNPSDQSSSPVYGLDDSGCMDVDEIIEATIREAANQEELDEPLKGQLHSSTLERIPADLYGVCQSPC